MIAGLLIGIGIGWWLKFAVDWKARGGFEEVRRVEWIQ